MSTISIKKILLTGTALVAVSIISAQTARADVVMTGPVTWGETAAGTNGSVGPGAGAGQNVDLNGAHTLTITNDQTANDGDGLNAFSLGTVDNNTNAAGAVAITQVAAGTAAPLTVTFTGITNSGAPGASTLTINSSNAAAQNVAVTIGSSGLTLGGDLTLNNNAVNSTNQVVVLTVNGVTEVTGTTAITAGSGANGGEAVAIINAGDAIYTGGVALGADAGTGAGDNAVMTLEGANNEFGNSVALEDSGNGSTEGEAILNLVGTSILTAVQGINGGGAGQGTVNLLGSNTILGAVGTSNSVFALNAGVEGTVSDITGGVAATTVTVNGGTDAAATGSITFGTTVTADTLIVESAGRTTAQVESATVNGNTSVTTLTAVAAGEFAGSNSTLTLNGAANTLAGATGEIATTAGTTATLNLNGAANTLSGTVTLIDSGTGSSGGQAIVNFGTGNTTDTVAGINGGGANEGTVNLLGSNVITGAIGAGTAVNKVTAGVEGTTSSISSTVNAGTVTVNGGANVAGTGTMTFGSTLTAGTGGLTVSSAGTSTAQIENATVTGVLADAGALNITAGAGNGANASLRLNGTASTNTITGATTLTDVASGGNATLTIGNGSSVTFSGGIVGGASGEGTLALLGTSTIGGQIGTAGNLLKSITLAGGGTDIFTGNVFATTIAYGASNSTVQIADGQNVTAAITATNTGTLTLSGASTLTGQIGVGGALLSTINAGASGKTDTFNSAVFTTNLNIGTGSVVLASGENFSGNINGTGAGVGNLVLSGNNTITGEIGNADLLNTLTLNGSGVTDTVTSAATVVNAANTTTLGTNTLAVGTNNFTLAAGQMLAATISSSTVYGRVTSTGATSVSPTSKINLTIGSNAFLPTTTFVLVGGGSGAGVGTLAAGALTVNGVNDGTSQTLTEGVITYTQVGAGTDELEIRATNNGARSVASTPNNISVAAAMDAIGNTGNAALQTVQGNIANATTAGAVNNILSTLQPTVDGGAQAVSLEVGTEVQSITDTRMTALRDDDGSSGVAAGATDNGTSMWFQGYGESASQAERDFIAGYHATTWGSAIGADSENIIDNGILGLAVNYGKATVDSKNLNTTKTDVSNYGLTLYGTVGLPDETYLQGQMGYAYNKITSTRHDVGGVASADADGSTNSSQYDARVTYGSDYTVAVLGNAILTPNASASYTYLSTQGYTETGPGADLDVSGNSQSNLSLGIGEKLAWYFRDPDGSIIKPVLKANYSYAVLDDRIDTTATFVGAAAGTNPSFATQGPTPERNRVDLGAGITYMTTANWDMSANYDFEYRPDYKANAGTLRATAHF